jgi:hypothetical protein
MKPDYMVYKEDSKDAMEVTTQKDFEVMQNIGKELHASTGPFIVPQAQNSRSHILDLCMAPGALLSAAMAQNYGRSATAYSLPVEAGGYKIQPHDIEVRV